MIGLFFEQYILLQQPRRREYLKRKVPMTFSEFQVISRKVSRILPLRSSFWFSVITNSTLNDYEFFDRISTSFMIRKPLLSVDYFDLHWFEASAYMCMCECVWVHTTYREAALWTYLQQAATLPLKSRNFELGRKFPHRDLRVGRPTTFRNHHSAGLDARKIKILVLKPELEHGH